MSLAAKTGVGGARHPVAAWWSSRYGAQMLVEIGICGGLLMIYRYVRTLSRTDLGAAFRHARKVVRLENWLGLPFEDNLQRFLLDHPLIIKFLNHYYVWFHFPVVISLLVWLYLRHPDRYRPIRNLLAFSTFTALIIHLAFPLAPPRMMDGFVDTMAKYGPSIYPDNALDGAANQIAAMPSLHFAWAMIEAIAVVSVVRTRWRWVAVVHPVLMTLAIIATANHWWIDAAAAGFLVLLGIGLYRMLRAWAGDRSWSWSALRFRPAAPGEMAEAVADSDVNEPVHC
ncbi:MAG: phosphatase PAP2 family protein [Ilumatobacteraceae bacterium]